MREHTHAHTHARTHLWEGLDPGVAGGDAEEGDEGRVEGPEVRRRHLPHTHTRTHTHTLDPGHCTDSAADRRQPPARDSED